MTLEAFLNFVEISILSDNDSTKFLLLQTNWRSWLKDFENFVDGKQNDRKYKNFDKMVMQWFYELL